MRAGKGNQEDEEYEEEEFGSKKSPSSAPNSNNANNGSPFCMFLPGSYVIVRSTYRMLCFYCTSSYSSDWFAYICGLFSSPFEFFES